MRSTRITNCSLTTEFKLVKENIQIQAERITQLYVIQSEAHPLLWFGVLFVDTGIYLGSVVRFNLYIDESYPDCPCPRVVFTPIPFHPLVDPITGELDTKNAFPKWNSTTHRLHELLLFVKRVLCQADIYIRQIQELISQTKTRASLDYEIVEQTMAQTRSQSKTISPETSKKDSVSHLKSLFLNFDSTLEFISVYENEPDEFQRRVDEFKNICCHQLLDRPVGCGNDKNALIFTPWDPDFHEPIRNCILSGKFAPTTLFASYHKETDSVSFVPGSEPPLSE